MTDPHGNHLKEMKRKIAWSIGSALGIPYHSDHSAPRKIALLMAIAIEESHQGVEHPTWGSPWTLIPQD